jgi:hypothetical protein
MLFRGLTKEEEKEFKQWAQDNYKPGEPIRTLWHPVIQEECEIINKKNKQDEKQVFE